MAKAKKSDASADGAAKPAAKTTRKKAPAKATKSPKATRTAKKTSASAGSLPPIDTSLAAQSAAQMLLARATGRTLAASPATESPTFKSLKEQIAKPKGALNNLLQSTSGKGAPLNSPLSQARGSAGHAQTHGADVARTGVPRRTSG